MKRIFLTIAAALSLTLGGQLAFQPAYAECASTNTPKGQVEQGIGAAGNECDTKGVTNFVNTVINVISIIAGIAAIIMIIVSGLKYITSGGDSNKVASAKSTLIYALIGVVIAALAQFLVHFVFTASRKAI